MSAPRSPSATALSPERARAVAAEVVQRHFGSRPRRMEPLAGGLTNHVLRVQAGREGLVVRLNADATKVHDFLKEQWAIEAARAAGVPASEVLEVGSMPEGEAFMLLKAVEGTPGTLHPDRMSLLRELGECAARIHRIRTRGFGRVFDWSSNRLSKRASWSDCLEQELHATLRLGVLERESAVQPAALGVLRRDLEAMRGWRMPPVLHHGDLRLKNVVVDGKGRIAALLDWEGCVSAPPPHWDLAIALHDLGVDEKEAFLDGYGIKPRRFFGLAPYLRVLNALHYAEALEAAKAQRRPTQAAWLRARLHGVFDLAPNSDEAA